MSTTAPRTLEDQTPPPAAGSAVPLRLSVMMFLQYAIWGIWLPYIANYLGAPVAAGGLGFSGGQIGWILGLAGSIGAVAAPFIAGQVADRWMNAERALALLVLLGGIVKYITAYATDYNTFLLLSIAYSVLYMPTLSLTNSISFQNLRDPEKRFPAVRSLGTLGWIVASSLFPLLWLNTGNAVADTARVADALKVSGVLSALYAVYAFAALPKTPPKTDVAHPLAFAEAFGLFAHRGFFVVTLVALPIAMIHQAYFFRIPLFLENDTGLPLRWIGPVLSIGQWSELVFLAILGLLLTRVGYKWVLALGCVAYAVRFAIFAHFEEPSLIIAAQALHGLCYGCFFAGSFLYVEKVAPPDIRHSAQTVFGIVILGVGPVLAGWYNQYFDRFQTDGAQRYEEFWWVQAAIAVASLAVLIIAFPWREQRDEADMTTAAEVGTPGQTASAAAGVEQPTSEVR